MEDFTMKKLSESLLWFISSLTLVLAMSHPVIGGDDGDWQRDGKKLFPASPNSNEVKVGIGTNNPEAKLHVKDGKGILISHGSGAAQLHFKDDDHGKTFSLRHIRFEKRFELFFEDNALLSVRNNGAVGIGKREPEARLHVMGGNGLLISHGLLGVKLQFKDDQDGDIFTLLHNRDQDRFVLQHNDKPLLVVNKGGRIGVGVLNPTAKLDVDGKTRTRVLEITGGADLAEPFEIEDPQTVLPGMVVTIDPEQPGKLRISEKAYDRTVAGIVSGANGLNPGLMMKQTGSIGDGTHPIALTGRVYCWADASNNSIQPGDLLTTSNTPGHAEKVSDYTRAHGAILGKAMSSLEKGKGLVLVLVTLQ
jgi:hypothetical protein